jgi:hypothetical protein
MSDQTPPPQGAFQPSLEALEGAVAFRDIPPAINPLQAQTAFERRASREDWVAHIIAIIQTSGFFLLAFAALLGFVNISNAATATFLGTVMGYAVGKVDPILTRYFHARGMKLEETRTHRADAAPSTGQPPPNGQEARPAP